MLHTFAPSAAASPPGAELQDWLEAEAGIEKVHGNSVNGDGWGLAC